MNHSQYISAIDDFKGDTKAYIAEIVDKNFVYHTIPLVHFCSRK